MRQISNPTKSYFSILNLVFFLFSLPLISQNCDTYKSQNEIQYCYIKKNKKGSKPKSMDIVQLLYSVALEDGTIIFSQLDSSSFYEFTIDNSEVFSGWNEAVKMMRTGESMRFVIPPHLAYGNSTVGKIKPNSKIVLEITLLGHYPAFYAELKDVVNSTKSGLKYKIYTKNENKDTVRHGNYVVINYTGYIIDKEGKRIIYDSSRKTNKSSIIQLGVDNLIPGLEEGLKLLKVGDFATFIIPPQLAYGSKKMNLIPPYSTIGFDIHLVEQINPFVEFNDSLMYSDDSTYYYQYYDKKSGENCELNDMVTLNLIGYYLTEKGVKKIFESSYEKNRPQSFRLNSFIENPVWLSILQKSTVGDVVKIKIPSHNARMELKKLIPENKDVYFEFEVVDNKKPVFFTAPFVDSILFENGIKMYFKEKSDEIIPSLDSTMSLVVDYTGYYIDTLNVLKVFDSSIDRNKPFEFKYKKGNVIEGWYQAMQYLNVGDKIMLNIPSQLAYGKNGFPPSIPPNQDIIFDLTLLNRIRKIPSITD